MSFGQKEMPKLHFIFASGKFYKGKAKTSNELEKELGFRTYAIYPREPGVKKVVFIKYTDIPIYAIAYDTISYNTLNEAFAKFDFVHYINSSMFTDDLKKDIKNKSFNNITDLIMFGDPDHYSETYVNGKKIQKYTFYDHHVILIFTNGILTNYIYSK